MADEYRPEDYERGDEQERYRSQRQGRFDYSGESYPGGYEGARPGRYDDQRYRERQSAPAGRYGQGQSSSRYGQQGWEREQQPDQYSRPNEWSRRPQEGEWQRQQQWELEGGPSGDWLPEGRGRGGYGQQGRYGQQPGQGNRGGPYGMEYPESGYSTPGGYGQMYRGEMGQYSGQSREGAYGRGQFAGRGPKGYSRSDDRIRDDVCERLTQAWDIDAEDIDVKVKDGEVTLSGSVMDRYQKRMAEDAVDGITGVRDINNQLRAGMGGERPGQMATPAGQYRQGSMGSTSSGTPSRSGTSRTTSGRSSSASGRSTTSNRSGTTSSRGSTTPRGASTPRTSTSSRSSSSRSGTSGTRSGTSAKPASSSTRSSAAGRSSTSSARPSTTPTRPSSSSSSQNRPTTPTPTEGRPQPQDPFQPESRPNF